MLKWKGLLGVALFGTTSTAYYQYHHNNSFRSLCNLGYAGINMALVYKYSHDPIESLHTRASIYLRDALRSNGGVYLKLGQLIATLDVIVPDQYRFVMGSLCRECQQESFQEIKKTVESQLQYPLEVVFKSFDTQPISSASIGQVHRAQLLNGQKVVVKVQHHLLERYVENDLKMMRTFVDVAKWLFKDFNYEWLVEGFQKNLRIELDFKIEAKNMKRTSQFLKENNFKDIYIPQIYLQPTRKVLIMEYINGVHINQLQMIKTLNIDTKKISKLFSNMIVKMIHKQGFVHADPHCGNIMVRKISKNKDQLVLLDHGLYQEMDEELIKNYNQFWLGLIMNDPKHYEPAGRHLGTTNPKLLCTILTSKTPDQLNDQNRNLFDLNPSNDRKKIMDEASKNHQKIVMVLSQLNKQILLLLKVNEFARTIENMLSGRQMGVYEDIARQCIENSGLSIFTRWSYYYKIYRAHQ